MIRTLINLLASFYESNDMRQVETIARSLHRAIPGDQVSLKFLGIVYYRTGRIKDAIHLFDLIQCRQKGALGAAHANAPQLPGDVDSAAAVCSHEAKQRVPYLAQAWQELGSALQKIRTFDCASVSRHGAVPA